MVAGAGDPQPTFELTNANSGVYIRGSDVSASASQITFDFSQSGENYFLIEADRFGAGAKYWCNASLTGDCNQGKSAVPETFDSPSAVYVPQEGLQVLATAGAAPEPAAWALMLVGFAGLGFVAVRRARALPAGA